jgi:DNA-binding winged helix-turn-helix (wHTH) protein
MDDSKPKTYRFGPFEVDVEQRRLSRAGKSVPLTPKAFDTLLVLVERPGKVIEKAELLKLVWPDTFVEENNLTQNISALRKVFGDRDYIETVPRRGYRFRMQVEDVSQPETGAVNPQSEAVSHSGRRRRSVRLWDEPCPCSRRSRLLRRERDSQRRATRLSRRFACSPAVCQPDRQLRG